MQFLAGLSRRLLIIRPYTFVHGCISLNHPFIRLYVHIRSSLFLSFSLPPSLFLAIRGVRSSDWTRSSRPYRVRGVADLTEGVVALVRLGPLSPYHIFLFLSILLFWSASRAPADLSSHRISLPLIADTICLFSTPSLSLSPLLLRRDFFLFFYYYSLSLIPPLCAVLYSYPTYCPFRSNSTVAGTKRNYSYLPPTLSDSRLFRGNRPPSSISSLLSCCPSSPLVLYSWSLSLLFFLSLSPLLSSFSCFLIFDCS